ncbi:hypothetical protein ACHAQH_003308 [Verticillium albo-atrum]
MASSADSSDLAGDIITYVGVPIAVAGLLPIIWSSAVTFIAWRKIKAKLERNNLVATTRSDPFTRSIEVHYVRYVITPEKRFGNRHNYSRQALAQEKVRRMLQGDHPEYIAGGTWAVLEWEKQPLKQHSQRIQDAEELRQPQAEINFRQLVAHLYDLGAIPDKNGWAKLLLNGLWTAPKTPLMNSPGDSKKPLLATAPFDHSDGHLSLTLTQHWADEWQSSRTSLISPYSVCLPAPKASMTGTSSKTSEVGPTTISGKEGDEKTACRKNEDTTDDCGLLDAQTRRANIICEISKTGLAEVYEENTDSQASVNTYDSMSWAHLRIRNGQRSDGIWFASAATAIGIDNDTILWKYKIPEDVLRFAMASTIPCGVLELLGFIDGSAAPSWTTSDRTQEYERLSSSRRIEEQVVAERAERDMPFDKRLAVSRERADRDYRQQRDHRAAQKIREDQARDERVRDALRSPTWDAKRVAGNCLHWLQGRGQLEGVDLTRDAVLAILRQMLLDREESASICDVLTRWKNWAGKGGMILEDLEVLQRSREPFAKGILVVATIMQSTARYEDVVLDLEECVNSWEIVRLG